jgi:VCBS repeat-containing protein
MKSITLRASLGACTCLAILSLGNGAALGADYFLRAEKIDMTMPGGASVPMWAFASCTDATFATCGSATVPGPALTVPPTEGLNVTVRNTLPAPVSLVIPGQVTMMTPVWDDGSSGPRPSATARVRSFTNETPPGGTGTYAWLNMRPGTYLYHSGTHPQVQVQMGLYGAATKDFAAGFAYPGVAYDEQVTLLYSEVDPALHAAVAGPTPTYGTASGPTSTLNYVPRYFLVNGMGYQAGDPAVATIGVGRNTLLRFINAGLRSHVPVIDGVAQMRMIAEDGNPYPWGGNPRQRYSVFLPAAKTSDALITAAPGTTRVSLHDRMLGLTNDMASGGMIALLDVSNSLGDAPTITSTPSTTALQGQPYSYQVTATDPQGGPFTFALDTGPAGMAMSASGLVSWTPSLSQLGPFAVTVRVTDNTARSTTQSFTVTVATDPAAHAPVITSTPVTTATYGVAYSYQVVASDADGNPLTYSLTTAPAGMTISASGLVQWTPIKSQVGTAGVTVRVTDSTTRFATQAYTITVANANYAPVANNDAYSMIQGGTLTRNAANGVLANDFEPDGQNMTAVLVTAPQGGGLTLNPNGSFTYTPPANIPTSNPTATRSFTYTAQDPGARVSNVATVTITIAENKAPVTVEDTFAAPVRTANAYTAVVLDVLANDSDPDTALDPTNRIDVATVVVANNAQPNKGGTATVNANGTISYTPARDFRGTETFSYRVRDTRGTLSAPATVRVNVQ